ncbi:MAG: PAS domain-containing protein [Deltaproteobacteria bacterium]|nr:PAS domain-containing protein [Deltaproteobacteria bacterium]
MTKKNSKSDTNEIILESISDGVFTVDHNWHIMTFNKSAEEITGISRKDAIGRHCWEVFRSNMCEGDCALKRTMSEGKPFVSTSTYIISSDKKKIPITASTSLLKGEGGKVLGGVEIFRDHSVVEELRKELNSRYEFSDMVSQNKEMLGIFKTLPQIAQSDSMIMIEGETGTGKELLARAIHNNSNRKNEKFIAVNCGALPDTLLESELFGYKKGAFTNANKDKPGMFELADGGTIFLDEIGDTSPAFQVRMLRVLQESEFIPLGGIETQSMNVRVITATNKDLRDEVEQGNFRQDLFYRINVYGIKMPKLKDRMEDVPLLVDRFIKKLNTIKGKSISGIHSSAMERLLSHNYPGNIRELENIIEHAFVLCDESTICENHLPVHLKKYVATDGKSLTDAVKVTEIMKIRQTLEENGYNRSVTANKLGMHKSTLFRKIKRYGISLPDGRSKN